MTRISIITITLGLTLTIIILALFKCCDLQRGSSWKGFLEVPGLFTAVVWSAPTIIHMSWYLWRRLHQNSVLALRLQHWMMPCTWQGGHFLTRCTVLSCSGRGLGQHALRFFNLDIVLPERCLGHPYPISLLTMSTWPRSEFLLYKIIWSKIYSKQTHFLASLVHWPADYKNYHYVYNVDCCFYQDIQLV